MQEEEERRDIMKYMMVTDIYKATQLRGNLPAIIEFQFDSQRICQY